MILIRFIYIWCSTIWRNAAPQPPSHCWLPSTHPTLGPRGPHAASLPCLHHLTCAIPSSWNDSSYILLGYFSRPSSRFSSFDLLKGSKSFLGPPLCLVHTFITYVIQSRDSLNVRHPCLGIKDMASRPSSAPLPAVLVHLSHQNKLP